MTREYTDTMMAIVGDHSGQGRLLSCIRQRILDLSARNTSHIVEFRGKDIRTVMLADNGNTIGEMSTLIWYDPDEVPEYGKQPVLELDSETASLARMWFRREETMDTLRTILQNQNKSDVIARLPVLKPLFDRTDAKIREDKENTERRRRQTIADLKAFFAKHGIEEEQEDEWA